MGITCFVRNVAKERPQYSGSHDGPADAEKKVRNFIIRNFEEIANDIGKGNGEYLSALYLILGIPEAEQKLMLKKLTVMAAENKEAPPFARAVLEQFERTGVTP